MTNAARADMKVGFACNNRCVFCAQGQKRADCGALSFEELLERLRSVAAPGRGLVLTGGEPTVRKDLPRLVAAARVLGFFPIQIQTNGRMLSYDRVIDALLAAGATEFSPSLHAATAECHDALTRAPGSFRDSVAGIRNLSRRGLDVVTNSVITRTNASGLPELVGLLASLGVRRAQLAFVHPVGTAFELFDSVVPRLFDIVEPIARAHEVALARGVQLVTEAVPLCFLRGREYLAVESRIPHTTVVDLDGAAADYSAWRTGEGKSHGPSCVGCARRGECEGPWREYPDVFGWEEFVPFDADGPTSDEEGRAL